MKGQTLRIFTYNKKFSFSTSNLYEKIVNRFFFHVKGKEIGKHKPKIFLANVLLFKTFLFLKMNLSQEVFRQNKNRMTPTYESFLLLHHTKWKYTKPSKKTKLRKHSSSGAKCKHCAH